MSDLDRIDDRLGGLAERSLDALAAMFDEGTGLFSQKTEVVDGAYANRGANVLYSAVSLVGILRQRRRPADGVLPVGRALDGIHAATLRSRRPGEIANLVWAMSIAEDRRGAELLDLLVEVDPAGCSSGELGQVLYGLSIGAETHAAGRDRAIAAATAAAAELLARFVPGPSVFRASPRRRLPRRELLEVGLTSFAAQVYPLHGLTAFHLLSGEGPPAAMAAVADRIVEAQGPLGQWWWIYSSRQRVVIEGYPVYSVHQDGMAFLGLLELERLGLGDFAGSLALGLDWVFGENELGAGLARGEPWLVHRCIQRIGSDADGAYGVSRANLRQVFWRSLAPLAAGERTGAAPGRLEILEECRSYHLGWLLYADSLVQDARARAADGGA
ncbi:MAG: hypothetical protein R2725_16470 [Solirubrobacterales bacterium]